MCPASVQMSRKSATRWDLMMHSGGDGEAAEEMVEVEVLTAE